MKKLLTIFGMGWISLQLAMTTVEARTFSLYSSAELPEAIQTFLKEYNILLSGTWAFLMLSACLIFVIHLTKLGQYSDQPFIRQKIMNDMLITGVCTALLGSFGLVFFLIQKLFL